MLPRTRVSSTPRNAPVVSPEPKRSRTPVMAAVALVVVLGGSGAGYFILKGKGEARANPPVEQQADTAKLNEQVPATPPVAHLAPAFAVIDSLVSITSNANTSTATQALAMLDTIIPKAQTDSDRVHLYLRQAEAHFVLGADTKSGSEERLQIKAGCDILKPHEGQAAKLRFKKYFDVYLYGDPTQGLQKTCP
jgi:hypothetical protein